MRRLVVTGKDTPENFRILFGTDQLGRLHIEQRREVLLTFLQQDGSPAAKANAFYDEGCPKFTPRPASAAETEELLVFLKDHQEMTSLLRKVVGDET